MENFTYLDHNASTPMYPEVKAIITEHLSWFGNPSSVHTIGRKNKHLIEKVRQNLAQHFTVSPDNIIFTSGATEANNLILANYKNNVLISAVEHDSIYKVLGQPQLSVDGNGIINLSELAKKLQVNSNVLVCAIAAHNETGVIQPLAEIIDICHYYGAKIHSDASQAVGKINLPWHKLDSFAISAHKFGGPAGAGALIVKNLQTLQPLIYGGGQERNFRSGTENFLGIIGMGTAITLQNKYQHDFIKLQKFIADEIRQNCAQAMIIGQDVPRLHNTACIYMPNVTNDLQLMKFDLEKIAVSNGSACSSGVVKTSRSLKAMGFSEEVANCTIRLSLGWSSTEQDVLKFTNTWQKIYQSSLLY